MQGLRRLLATALLAGSVTCAVLAASRPYADNQRNWLVLAAVSALLAVAAPLLLRLLVSGARAVRAEWTPRRRAGR